MTEREYLVAVCSYISFGPQRTKLLLSFFGNAKRIWLAQREELRETGLSYKIVNGFIKHRRYFKADKYFKRLKQLSINYLTIKDKNYPKNLRDLDNVPVVLYLKGRIKQSDINSIAIVGSRKATSYGKMVVEKFVREFVSSGLTIVSGLARGIDTCAHKYALENKGRTIAVFGCGLDRIYPPENSYLAREIEKNGALISEYPLGYPVRPFNFANRNRIISGLSKAVLVIEGAEKSGTLLTASHAAQQGRTVFAVPGPITSPLSGAPHFLLKRGANLAVSAKDVLEEISPS